MGSGSNAYVVRIFAAQVPRSSKLIYEDNDYALYSVTLFKRVADSFKQAARSKGFQVLRQQPLKFLPPLEPGCLLHSLAQMLQWSCIVTALSGTSCKFCVTQWCVVTLQVRDYEFDQEMQSNQSEAAKSLKANADKKRKQLEEWSASAYGEVPSTLIRCLEICYCGHTCQSGRGWRQSRTSQEVVHALIQMASLLTVAEGSTAL